MRYLDYSSNPLTEIVLYFSIAFSLFVLLSILGPQIYGRVAPVIREYWVHPVNQRRDESGIYSSLIRELRNYPVKHKQFLRISPTHFNHLLARITPEIQKADTNMRKSIPPEIRLAITLYYMATGTTLSNIHLLFRVGQSTARKIIKEVSTAIYDSLSSEYMTLPTSAADWRNISNGFHDRWNYPNCIGSVDGKHVRISLPKNAGSEYFNYKGYHSIVLMAVVDADYRFVMIDVGQLGGASDGAVWRECSFNNQLITNQLNIPEPTAMPGYDAFMCPYHLIGDDAFPLKEHMMKPYPGRGLTRDKRIFNYRLSRARRVVENAFGILTVRFRCLLGTMTLAPETTTQVVAAACALHNYLISSADEVYCPPGLLDIPLPNGTIMEGNLRTEVGNNLDALQATSARRSPATALQMRNNICDYFNEVGKTTFQDFMIDRRA